MAYHFIFREVVYYDQLPIGYEVPDYLYYDDTTYHRRCVSYTYTSRYYATLAAAMTDYYHVLDVSGQRSSPQFYENGEYMSNATTLFNDYMKIRRSEE